MPLTLLSSPSGSPIIGGRTRHRPVGSDKPGGGWYFTTVNCRKADSSDPAVESEWISRAKAGNFEAFDCLVRSCEKRAWSIAWRLAGVKEDAENIIQAAFLKAMGALDGFRGDAGFCAWMSRIVTHEGLDLLRRRRRDAASLDGLTEEDDEGGIAMPSLIADWRENPSQGVERREIRDILDRALDTLTPGLRSVFVLRDIEERSTAETAQALGISEGNVKLRLLRARLALRERLTEALGGPNSVASHLVPHGLGGLAAGKEGES